MGKIDLVIRLDSKEKTISPFPELNSFLLCGNVAKGSSEVGASQDDACPP